MKEFRNTSWKLIKKKFQFFIYGTPTSIKVSGQDEDLEVRPSGTTQEEEVQIEKPQDLKSGVA